MGLTACEDASKVRLLNRAGKEVLKDRDRLFVQYLTASKIGNRWKITAADGKAVKSFDYEWVPTVRPADCTLGITGLGGSPRCRYRWTGVG